MGHPSTPRFRTFHALRIKGFADSETLSEITGYELEHVEVHLVELAGEGHAQYRENRALWQLTADGRSAHPEHLAHDLDGIDASAELAESYDAFMQLNSRFKDLCGDWQLRDGEPNDHSDAAYDAKIIDRLAALHAEARPVVEAIGERIERLAPYAPRLDSVFERVQNGETQQFTGVMCGSYHDVWMELHEDLILTQGIDRAQEGSF